MLRIHLIAPLAVIGLAPLALGEGLTITHDPVGCVQADRFPRLFARLAPGTAVSQARVHFRPDGWPHWYSVPMKFEAPSWAATLPKPDKSLNGFHYYVSAMDRSFFESRTQEYFPSVVSDPGGCQGNKVLAVALSRARGIVVTPPAGIANPPSVPAGFSGEGVVGAATGPSTGAASQATSGPPAGSAARGGSVATGAGGSASAAAAGATGAATSSGGLSTGLIVAGSVVAAAGVAVGVVAATNENDALPTGTFRGASAPFSVPVTFTAPGAFLQGCSYDVLFVYDIEILINDAEGILIFVESDGGEARTRGGVSAGGQPCDSFQFVSSETQMPLVVRGEAVSGSVVSPSGSIRSAFEGRRSGRQIAGTFTSSDNNPNDNPSWGVGTTTITTQLEP